MLPTPKTNFEKLLKGLVDKMTGNSPTNLPTPSSNSEHYLAEIVKNFANGGGSGGGGAVGDNPPSSGGTIGSGDLESRVSALEDYYNKHFYPVTPVKPVKIVDFESFKNDARYGVIESGTYPWVVDRSETQISLKSTNQGKDNTISWTEITFEITDLTGTIEFEYFVSCEGSSDRVQIYVNGALWFTSGDMTTWAKTSRQFVRGIHTIRFEYFKDGSIHRNLDTAFVRSIKITG